MAALLNILLIFVAFFSFVNCAAEIKPCSGTQVTEAFIGDCTKPPCPLKRGTNMWFNVTFVSPEDSAKTKTNIYGTMVGIKHGWPGLDGLGACDLITPTCPVNKGETYKFAANVEIKKAFPKVSLPMHVAIKGDGGKDLACFDVGVKVV